MYDKDATNSVGVKCLQCKKEILVLIPPKGYSIVKFLNDYYSQIMNEI